LTVLDFIVIGIIGLSVFYYYRRGFAVAVLSFFSYILAFFVARALYPFIAAFLRNTGGLFEWLKGWVANRLDLSAAVGDSLEGIVNGLSLPMFIQKQLISNYGADVLTSLKATSVEDYIAAFIANAIINLIAVVFTFVVALAVIKVAINVVDIMTRLPVIKQINKFFGAALGAVIGVFIVWTVLTVLVWVFGSNPSFHVNDMLDNSLIAKPFQNINVISRMLARTP
jgi:uncharacterized membrane protein required for colicin V production